MRTVWSLDQDLAGYVDPESWNKKIQIMGSKHFFTIKQLIILATGLKATKLFHNDTSLIPSSGVVEIRQS